MRYCNVFYLMSDEGMDMYEQFYVNVLRPCQSIIPATIRELQDRYGKQFDKFVKDLKGE